MSSPVAAKQLPTPVRLDVAPPESLGHTQGTARKHTYGQILKSTAVIGGSTVINIAIGVVRNKAMAMFLGPAGVGLMGLYNSVADLTWSFASMGVQSSGVRQIADAIGTADDNRIAITATVLRRVSVLLGVLGAALLVGLANPISELTFGSRDHTVGVTCLSLAVLCRLVSGGQSALIQGTRRIADLASMNVWAAVLGTTASVAIVYVLRDHGVVPSIIAVWAATLVASWCYSRRVSVERPSMAWSDVGRETAALLKLGAAFMVSGLLTMGAAYVIRIVVLHAAGFTAAGIYQSAWAIGGLYVGLILQSMGADFYPRLTAVHRDDAECTRLVNEQAQISLLLAGPGVLATLSMAPLVIAVFYSADFAAAVPLLRWICLGMTLRVVAWPMGFIVLAKGAQQIYFWTEIAATLVHVGLAWLLVGRIGVDGAGIAFFGLYVWHSLLIYVVVRRLSSFRWSPANRRLGVTFLPLVAGVFVSPYVLPSWLALSSGMLATACCGVYSLRTLMKLLPDGLLPAPARAALSRFGWVVGTGASGEREHHGH